MPLVKMPNGQVVDMPDKITPELEKSLREIHPEIFGEEPSLGQKAVTGLKAIGEKAKELGGEYGREALAVADAGVKGAMIIPKTVVDAGATLSGMADRNLPESMRIPGATQALQKISGFLTPIQAKTPTGKALSNIAASTAGGMIAPGSKLTNAAIGLGAGLGSEGAASVLGDNPVTRIGGGLVGGGIGSLRGAFQDNSPALAREAIEGVPTRDLNRAIGTMQQAKQEGVPLNLSQALDQPSNVDAYIGTLAQNQAGKQTSNLLREQPIRVQEEARRRIGAMPGQPLDDLSAANNLKGAAQARIAQLGEQRADIFRRTLADSQLRHPQAVPTHEMFNAIMNLERRRNQYTPSSAEHRLLTDLQGRLFNNGNMLTNPEQIYQTIRSFKGDYDPGNLAASNINKDAAKYVKGIATSITQNMRAMQPYRDADDAFRQFTRAEINPVKRSIVGTIAGKKRQPEDQSANVNLVENVFKKGTTEGGNSSILRLADELNLAGRGEDFLNSAKTHIANKVDEAFRSQTNRVNEASAGNLKRALGSETQLDNVARGTNDILIGQARIRGIPDEAAYADGFKKFMNIVARAANRPSSVSGTSREDILEKAGSHLLKRTGQFSIITPLRQPILWWSEKLKLDSLGTIDNLLNSPEGVRMLVELGKQPRLGHKAQTAISTFLATTAGMASNEVQTNQIGQ